MFISMVHLELRGRAGKFSNLEIISFVILH